MDRKILRASEGMILTDGETYGSEIYLAEGVDKTKFKEISLEEYNEIMLAEEAVNL